jgi:T5SS/PEP-CTERM-associated repeat protein
VQDALTVKRSVLSLDTVNISGSGASLTASTFHQVGAGAVLNLTSGASLDLTGGASTDGTGGAGNTGAVLDGQTIIDHATLNAGGGVVSGSVGGYIAIGVASPTGNVLVENGGSVTATYTVLASSKIGGGTLTLEGSGTNWTDTSIDPSLSAPIGMIVGLGGVADPNAGGNATHLNVLSGASLTDNGTVVIGFNSGVMYGGQGNVTVADGGTWTINGSAPLFIGADGGNGQLDVSSGGQVLLNGGDIYVNAFPVNGNGSGFVNVSGAGAVISTTGGLNVGGNGDAGIAQFNVISGGHVTVGGAVLGTGTGIGGSGGTASIQASDSGTLLTINGNLSMGGQDATLIDWTGSGGPGTGASIVIGSGGSATAGATTVVSGFAISGAGMVQGEIIDNGLIFAASGQTLTLNGGNGGSVIVGSGVLVINNGATLDLMNIAVGTGPQSNAPTVAFNAGAAGTLELGLPGSMFGNIQNFTSGDQIDLTGATPANLSFSYNNNVLAVSSGGVSIANLQIGSGYTNDIFNAVADGHGGAAVTFTNQPCYCRGTRVLTDQGEVAVEDLKIDDRLITVSGLARPIRWIGTRGYAGRFAARNTEVLPIHIKQGALGDNLPVRDLYVSPLHALFIDGVLIPAQNLVNGGSIVKMKAVDSVEYFHLELESHDVILAEGVPAESYLDDHNRSMFQNVGDYRTLYPEAELVAPVYCAPRLEGGELVTAIRARLAARAVAMGFEVPGSVSIELAVGRNRALVRAGVGEVRLLAPVFHAPGDARPLGAQIRGVKVHKVAIDLADRRLTQGFYPIETDGASKLRWTNGEAVIELDPVGYNRWCEIDVAAMGEPMVANG